MATKKHWREAREKVDKEGRCRVCKNRPQQSIFGKLEAAHTIGQKDQDEARVEVRGGLSERIRWVNPASTVPLCVKCHQAYDAHRLDLLAHLTIEEQVNAVASVGIERAYRRLTSQMKVQEIAL